MRNLSPDKLSYKCRDCGQLYAKERYAKEEWLRKHIASKAALWAKANIKRRREIVNKSDNKHIEKKRMRRKEYEKTMRNLYPEKTRMNGRISAQIRRHRMHRSNSFINLGVASRIIQKAGGICTYCELPAKLTLDHFEPVSKGGCGAWWNIVACCGSCNTSKKDKDGPTWIEKKFGIDGLVRVCRTLEAASSVRLP